MRLVSFDLKLPDFGLLILSRIDEKKICLMGLGWCWFCSLITFTSNSFMFSVYFNDRECFRVCGTLRLVFSFWIWLVWCGNSWAQHFKTRLGCSCCIGMMWEGSLGKLSTLLVCILRKGLWLSALYGKWNFFWYKQWVKRISVDVVVIDC